MCMQVLPERPLSQRESTAKRRTTSIPDWKFNAVLRQATVLLRSGSPLTNAAVRARAKVTYDEATRFFNMAVERGLLAKLGSGSGTHYVGR